MPVQEVVGTSGTLQLGGPGVAVKLKNVIVGTSAASAVVTLYKGVGTAGTKIAEIDASTVAGHPEFGTTILGGLYVTVTGGSAKVSISYE